jgi:hypothetical protein
MILQRATVSILCLTERALFQDGLMERLEPFFPRVASYSGLSTKLTSQETKHLEESLVFALPVIATISFQEAQMVK